MEMKAAAEAEGTEEAWNAYAFERDGWDGPGMGVDYNEDTGKFTLAEGYIADEDGWVVLRDAVMALAYSDLTLSIHREWTK